VQGEARRRDISHRLARKEGRVALLTLKSEPQNYSGGKEGSGAKKGFNDGAAFHATRHKSGAGGKK